MGSTIIIDRKYTKAVNLYLYIESQLDKIQEQSRQGEDTGVFEQVKHLLSSLGEYEVFFYQQILIPITVTIAHDILTSKLLEEDYYNTIDSLFEDLEPAANDKYSLQFSCEIFQNVLVKRISDEELDVFLSTYTGPYVSQITSIAHVLHGIHNDALSAAKLQLPIAQGLDFFKKSLSPFYRFELVPFLESFWVWKFNQYPRQVKSISSWHERSLPHVRKAVIEDKLRKIFEVIVHHLELSISPELENWIYE